MQEGRNVFLTGSAGAGKTYTLNKFIEWGWASGKHLAITASTGIAATHIGGQTIHAFSGIGIAEEIDKGFFTKWGFKEFKAPSIREVDVLIIDEISMLGRKQFEMVDTVFRKVRRKSEPFGGVQLIVCGDFFQLPPISRDAKNPAQFAINSPVWEEADIATCYLTEQHRSSDAVYNTLLESIRSGNVGPKLIASLESRIMQHSDDMDTTHLYTTNRNVDAYNLSQLKKINAPMHEYRMTDSGSATWVKSLKKSCLANELLTLKEGALVMALKNDPEGRYVNGSIGHVVNFKKGEKGQVRMPEVSFLNGKKCVMTPAAWEMISGESRLAKIVQVPLRLAWGITVHKSQGMTLDRAHINLQNAFEPGQGYVALSRLRRLGDLTLQGINDMALQVSIDALRLDEFLRNDAVAVEMMYR